MTNAPGVRGRQRAVKLITPADIAPVATVKIISSLVTTNGKLVAVSAAKAAGEAIQVLFCEIVVAVVVVMIPVARVAVPRAKVPVPALTGVIKLWGYILRATTPVTWNKRRAPICPVLVPSKVAV